MKGWVSCLLPFTYTRRILLICDFSVVRYANLNYFHLKVMVNLYYGKVFHFGL
jgi:hypothetical protein